MGLNMIRSQWLLTIFCLVAGANSQTSPSPPVKMGLWETSTTPETQLPPKLAANIQAMRDAAHVSSQTVTLACLAPEQWQREVEEMPKLLDSECVVSSVRAEGRTFSFSTSCRSRTGPRGGNWEFWFLDSEHLRGTGYLYDEVAGSGPLLRNVESRVIHSHFVMQSCGSVRPGSPQLIKRR